MNSTPEADPALLEAHDVALAALREITHAHTIGDPVGHRVEADGVVSLLFANRMPGYPGWFWTVSLARVEGEAPTVLEVELLPGESALVAPEWVPWAVRLADYQAHQAQVAAEREAEGDAEGDEGLDDVDDLDAADFDDDGSPILHSGDVDGVDIDGFDEDSEDDSDDDEDDSDDDEDDEDDSDDDSDDDDSEDDSDDDDDDDDSGDDDSDDDEDSDSDDDSDELDDDAFLSDEDDLGDGELSER
ncbi:MAG: DUF3027 domain-containing protein [Microbacterium sp.]|uniref:DUF3027 domain-containing protein n=1 Tax=unclassified Microbacterium TaxID=2609290 RepID=UPI000DB03D94|nr:DUF3027 domain-containing protein [Microbacterium sp.]PZU37771.1 MAG: DUF3027 domain-containing protein [Microbacterium sp.]